MANIPGTNVIAPVVPLSTTDTHPSHEALYGKGGYRTVATTAARDAIPAARREVGMLVYVVADETIYSLGSDLSTWAPLELGSTLPAGTEGYVLTYVSGSWVASAPQAGVSSWNDLTDKPTLFSGAYGDLTGKPDLSVYLTSVSWNDIGAKPTTFPPSSHTHDDRYYTESEVDSLLAGKATPSDVSTAVANLVNAAPASLDTLKELADALGNDANFATTVTNALAAKAPLANPTFTGTVSGVTKAMVGLGNVDNTSDASKPISTAVQSALDGKLSSTDASVTNAREWTADTVSQAEAEAGTSTTRRAWTALRVFQAIAAWWAASSAKTKLDGIAAGATANATDAQLRDRSTHTGTQDHTTITGLGTLATQSGTFSGTSSGTNTGDQTISLTGDVTGSGTGTFAATLANTAVTAGSYGSASSVATYTVDAKGRLTSAGSTAIAISAGAVSGLGGAATLNVGTSAGTVAAGNDSRFTDTRVPTDGSVTDSSITSGGLSASSINWTAIAAWAPSTAYAKGDLVSYLGVAYRRSAAGTSGATFNTSNWQQVTPSTFNRLSDTVSNVSYIGLAPSGSATSASVWRIKRTTIGTSGSVSASVTATNVAWTDRLTASYS